MKLKKHTLLLIAALAVTFMVIESSVALEAPANLTATVNGNKVTLDWDAAIGATGYKLYYSIGRFSKVYDGSIDVGNLTSIEYDGLPDETYYAAVTAYDGLGGSGFSNEADFPVYEPNDTFEQANVIVLNDTASQKHNFHAAGDRDWVKFYAITGEWYSIEKIGASTNILPLTSRHKAKADANAFLSVSISEILYAWKQILSRVF